MSVWHKGVPPVLFLPRTRANHLTKRLPCPTIPRRRLSRQLITIFDMSTELPQKQGPSSQTGTITIVAAEYNDKFITPLLENCLAELRETLPRVRVDVVRVPGAFEVPVMVKRSITLADEEEKPDVVIALGVILRGSTAHADLIGNSITQKLLDIACETITPVIHEVLLLDDEAQAFARCVGSSLNRGREAARAAASMLRLMEAGRIRQRAAERLRRIDVTASPFVVR